MEASGLTPFVSRSGFDWLPVGVIAGLRTVGINWGPTSCDMHPGQGRASWVGVHYRKPLHHRRFELQLQVVQKKILVYSSSIILS